MFIFHSVNRILEAVNSAYTAHQTMNSWNFSLAYVMIEDADETEVLKDVSEC